MAQRMQDPEPDTDRNVRLVVQMLMAATETDPAGLAVALGVGRSAVYEKLNGHRRFTIADVGRLAHHFGVDAGVFFTSPRKLLGTAATLTRDTVGYRASAGQGPSFRGATRVQTVPDGTPAAA